MLLQTKQERYALEESNELCFRRAGCVEDSQIVTRRQCASANDAVKAARNVDQLLETENCNIVNRRD